MTQNKSLIILLLALATVACSSENQEPEMAAMSPIDNNGQNMDDSADDEAMTEYQCDGSDHPLVGSMAILETRSHMVSGNATFSDNCTLVISNFTYDGEGPSVYFYGGIDNQFTDTNGGFVIGEQLNGTVFENDTITIKFTDTYHLSAMNSISVWCADFAVSFGDGLFL